MSKSPLKNIPLRVFRQYLIWNGLKLKRTSSGHEVWKKAGMKRSVIVPTHKDPVREFVVKNALINKGKDIDNLIKFLES